MKNIGLALITVSFLAGAYLAVLDDTTVEWTTFGIVLVIGFAGVFLARKGSHSAATDAGVLQSNMATVRSSLENVVHHVEQLNAEKESIPTYDMGKEIDKRVMDDLNDFVETRKSISHTFGLQAYADVMSHFAGGERYLNRVWSASADGYVNEVNDFLNRSLEQFLLANEKLNALLPAGEPDSKTATRGW